MCPPRSTRALLLAALLAAASSIPARGQEVPVPADLQAKLFATILGFDRELQPGPDGAVVVGILVQRHYRPSLEAAEDLMAAVAAMPRSNPRVRTVMLDADGEGLEHQLLRHGCSAIYVTPLRALSVEAVAGEARRLGVRSLTGVPIYVRRGISVGLGLRDRRPEILINLRAARAEGADYSAQLLDMARLIDEGG